MPGPRCVPRCVKNPHANVIGIIGRSCSYATLNVAPYAMRSVAY